MRRVSYKSVIAKVAGLLKGQATLSAEEEALANVFVNQKAGEFWEGTFWPEWTVSEKRYFRKAWNKSDSYAAPTLTSANEVFYIATEKYYQALRNPSLDVFSLTRVGPVATVTFVDVHGLSTGDLVEFTGAGQVEYLVPASVTVVDLYTVTFAVSGAPATPGTGTIVGHVHPVRADLATANTAYWAECAGAYSGSNYAAGVALAVGDTVYDTVLGRYQMCFTAHTTGAVLTQSNFGILTEFVRSIDFTQSWEETVIGDAKEIWDGNPETLEPSERCEILFDLLEGKVLVRGTKTVVWVVFRLTVPSWTGDDYSSTATYASGDQVYDDTQGDFYVSLQSANTGHAVTDAAWWERIDFPYDLRDCVALAAYAEMLEPDGEHDQSVVMAAKASRLWKASVDRYERQQGQAGQMRVKGR